MSEQIIAILKRKIESLSVYGAVDAETRLNALKEELQFYVLNFIYHHQEYGDWVMYGGSALRIIHGLDRMSVDLDFEVSYEVTEKFLSELKMEIEDYFANTYGAGNGFLTIKITAGRGLILKFHVGKELSLGRPSDQVHVKIDLNYFAASKTVIDRQPINRGQLSFVIRTYNMGALMASKLAAIFLRGSRATGQIVYEEKGRDIYDLLWYMGKKIVPDFDYLIAKGIKVNDPKALFDKITLKILNNPQTDVNLKYDLTPLFLDQAFIANWLKNWRVSYLRLLEDYKIRTIKEFERVTTHQNPLSNIFSFIFWYKTEEEGAVKVSYAVTDDWIIFNDINLEIEIDKEVKKKSEISDYGWSSKANAHEKILRYASLFYQKTENYLKKTNRIILGDGITTKLIRMTADNLNSNEQILLNKSALLSCELDDLLK